MFLCCCVTSLVCVPMSLWWLTGGIFAAVNTRWMRKWHPSHCTHQILANIERCNLKFVGQSHMTTCPTLRTLAMTLRSVKPCRCGHSRAPFFVIFVPPFNLFVFLSKRDFMACGEYQILAKIPSNFCPLNTKYTILFATKILIPLPIQKIKQKCCPKIDGPPFNRDKLHLMGYFLKQRALPYGQWIARY